MPSEERNLLLMNMYRNGFTAEDHLETEPGCAYGQRISPTGEDQENGVGKGNEDI